MPLCEPYREGVERVGVDWYRVWVVAVQVAYGRPV
jgi:hypothetical protein